MEAIPRMPMIAFDLLSSCDHVLFGNAIKPFIASVYNEDPESYSTEINNMDTLRARVTHPTIDVAGVQLMKKYYCQLHSLKSRFPHADLKFEWRYEQNSIVSGPIDVELMAVMHNIGVLHTILGATDSRSTADGMKMACTHFQCAVWSFQTVMVKYPEYFANVMPIQVLQFYKDVCLAQAQECILEKSILDNRKAAIISKVAVQVCDYYRHSLACLKEIDGAFGRSRYKEYLKHIQFKFEYSRCLALFYQGQQSEELQKMGESVAFYRGASQHILEAKKYLKSDQPSEFLDGLSLLIDIVETKKNTSVKQNEFIYHEEVPALGNLVEVKGASLVKGIEFNINDPEIIGDDIFAKLIPLGAHEASSLYSEKKAQILRDIGSKIEVTDHALAEFMSSMQLDILMQMHHATGIPQEIIDRAAALSAKPNALQNLIDSMAKLSNIYHDVEANLNEIDIYLKEEEENEKSYQEKMGKRPSSIITADLAREALKYKEAHKKANESNQTLSKAMMAHLENLKILQTPIRELQRKLPSVEMTDPNIDENLVRELDMLNSKVDEMRAQRAMLWAQLRDSIHNDDITNVLVKKQPHQTLDDLFHKELEKHSVLINILEQNLAAQDNVKKAFVDCYARAIHTRRYIQDIIQKRNSTIQSLIASHDTYDDLLTKANKGIEFYTKLETNVTKLLQRVKGANKVQQEEREQILAKNEPKKKEVTPVINTSTASSTTTGLKLKDFLDARKKLQSNYPNTYITGVSDMHNRPPSVRPTPLGSEVDKDLSFQVKNEAGNPYYQQITMPPHQNIPDPSVMPTTIADLTKKMANLMAASVPVSSAANPHQTFTYSNYVPQSYSPISYTYPSHYYADTQLHNTSIGSDAMKEVTKTTSAYQTITSNLSNAAAAAAAAAAAVGSDVNQYKQEDNMTAQYSTNQSYLPYECPTQYQQYTSYTDQSPAAIIGATNQFQPQQQVAFSAPPSAVVPQPYDTSLFNLPETINQIRSGVASGIQQAAGNTYPPANDTYYPYGYSPITEAAPLQTYYGSVPNYVQEHPSYVNSNMYNNNFATTFSSPTNEDYKLQANTSNMSNDTFNTSYDTTNLSTSTNYSSTEPSNAYNNYFHYNPANYSTYYPAQVTVGYNVATSNEAVPKQSNVDLLTGLDISSDSYVPTLIPEQKALEPAVKEPQIQQDTVGIEETKTTVDTPIIPQQEVTKKEIVTILYSKPLANNEVKVLLTQEIDKYEKYVDTLCTKTLNGPTTLDAKWKEIQDSQITDCQNSMISVARCYPMKNRFPDILPYDFSRVELQTTGDDYINASLVKPLSQYNPYFIVTQLPLSTTIGDFWTMIKEQQVELIFCLLSDKEIGNEIYWPTEKGKVLTIQNLTISLHQSITKSNWIERVISINNSATKENFHVMHLQFTSWPGSLFPTSADSFVSYVEELINLFQQQRVLSNPIVIHCLSGIGRSGLLALVTNAILDLTNEANSIPDLANLTTKLASYCKNILRDREHLKFAYETLLCYMKRLLAKDQVKPEPTDTTGLITINPIVEEKTIDPLSTLDPFWVSKKEEKND